MCVCYISKTQICRKLIFFETVSVFRYSAKSHFLYQLWPYFQETLVLSDILWLKVSKIYNNIFLKWPKTFNFKFCSFQDPLWGRDKTWKFFKNIFSTHLCLIERVIRCWFFFNSMCLAHEISRKRPKRGLACYLGAKKLSIQVLTKKKW